MAKEKDNVKFEDKIKELEDIVNELESGEIDLDSSIKKYTSDVVGEEWLTLIEESDVYE